MVASKKAKGKQRKKRSLAFRLARAVVVVVAALIIAVLALVHSGAGREWVRGRIEQRITHRVNGSFKLDSVDYALFGNVSLHGARILDTKDNVVIRLDTLEVDPSWWDLVRGSIVVDGVGLDGLAINVEKYEDGSSNLQKLFKKSPPSEPAPEPSNRRIQVKSLTISDVDLALDRPDGSRIELVNVGLDASVDATPGAKSAELNVARLVGEFTLTKALGAMRLSVTSFQTGLSLSLDHGKGNLQLAKTRGHVKLEQDGANPREMDVDFGGFDLEVGEGTLAASVKPLLVGALLLEGLTLEGAAKDGSLFGDQSAELIGLNIDAKKLNTLLQRELLASNVAIRTKVTGPANALETSGSLRFERGGSVTLTGTLDLAQRDLPGYDLTARVADLDTAKLLVQGATKAPPTKVKDLRLTIKGKGATREKADAEIGLTAGPIHVGGVAIDRATMRARYVNGKLSIEELIVEALGQKAFLDGEMLLANKRIKAKLRIEGDVGEALDRLREAGIPVNARVPVGALRLHDDSVVLSVEGPLDGVLNATVDVNQLALAGGTISLHTNADLQRKEPGSDGKRVVLLSQSSQLDVRGVRIERLLALRGKRLDGYTGTVSGHAKTEGSLENLLVRFNVRARAQAVDSRGSDAPVLAVALDGSATKSMLDATVKAERRQDGQQTELLRGSVRLPLVVEKERKGLAIHRPMRAKLTMQGALADLLSVANQDRLGEAPPGRVQLELALAGTPANPTGTLTLDANAQLSPVASQRIRLDGKLAPRGRHTVFSANTHVWLNTDEPPSLTSVASVDLSSSPLVPGYRSVDWDATMDVRRHEIGSIPFAVDKLQDLDGEFEAHVQLAGTREDVLGQVRVGVVGIRRADEMGPFDANVAIAIQRERTEVGVDVDIATGRLLSADGSVGVAGMGLIPTVRGGAHRTAPLAFTLHVPRQALSNLSVFRRKLAEYEGELCGDVEVGGVVSKPTAKGNVVVDRFDTLAGTPGKVALRLDAGEERIAAQIGVGMPEEGAPPVTIDLELIRAALGGYRSGDGELPLRAVAHASNVELARLVPAKAAKGHKLDVTGRLNWDMRGVVGLRKTEGQPPIERGRLDGSLTVTGGGVSIPGTRRRYQDIELKIVSDGDALRLERLSARESDLANPNRRIGLTGRVAWSNLQPNRAQLALEASDWLVFGGGPVGPADAPRGTLSMNAKVDADLSRPVRVVNVNVAALELLVPQRFPKAHAPEEMHLGDVIFLDETDAPPGKLPVPERKKPELPASEQRVASKGPAAGYDIHVRIPNRAHLLSDPMDLQVRGEIDVTIREGQKRHTSGELRPEGGYLMLGGRNHDFDHGKIVFTDACPGGCMDLHFAYPIADASLRDFLLPSQGDTVRITMKGPLNAYETTLAGVGSPGTLFDLLAIHNTGRARYTSEPDMPATMTVQYPQYWNLMMLGFMRVNLPHMLFLDRIAAWADPYDARDSYGRVQNFEGEAHPSEGTRVRAIVRPVQTGRSQAELQYDWLLMHDDRAAVGVGFRAGSRLGGGPGVTIDWSSED